MKKPAISFTARRLVRDLLADPEEQQVPWQQLQLQARDSKQGPLRLGRGGPAAAAAASPVSPHGLLG